MPYYGVSRLQVIEKMIQTERTGAMEPNQNDAGNAPELVTEALVEEVSIDGMCGVY
jgi:mycofactocin precursor